MVEIKSVDQLITLFARVLPRSTLVNQTILYS